MQVLVTNVFGRSVKYSVEGNWSVLQLKILYAQEYSTSYTNWYLMFNGKFLQNENLLSDYNVQDGSTIHVTHRIIHRMLNPVELRIIYNEYKDYEDSPEEKIALMYAEADWSIKRVRREFAQIREFKDWKKHKLYCNGICLNEKSTLADYHIQNDATLHLSHPSRSRKFGIAGLKRYLVGKHLLKIL